jgi:membrane associated rhomboid family serine protease
MPSQGMPQIDLGRNWTPLVRTVLITLFVIYVVQLLTAPLMTDLFAWQPIGAGFRPWQVITAPFLGGEPIGTVFTWLTLYFFLPLLEGTLGLKKLGQATAFAWFFAVLLTFGGMALGLQDGTMLGGGPILLAYTALFGFLLPDLTFLLFFIIPMKAKWIGWGAGLLAFLYFLYTPHMVTALAIFAWVGAWLWAGWHNGAFRRMRLQAQRRKVQKQMSRLEVLDGGKSKPQDWVN